MVASITVDRIEVTQVLQDTPDGKESSAGSVELYAGKKTIVRVYLSHVSSALFGIPLRGELKLSGFRDAVGSVSSPSYNSASPELMSQRLNWGYSLNFVLDGKYVSSVGERSASITIMTDTQCSEEVRFRNPKKIANIKWNLVEAPFLRVTALVLRYRDKQNRKFVAPSYQEVDLIRQWLESAFPVAKVDWDVVYVEATDRFRALNPADVYDDRMETIVNRELKELLLQTTVHWNQDPVRTAGDGAKQWRLYLGVYADPSNMLGGAAVNSPPFPTHTSVGVTVVDSTGETGAHEIGHMLGLKHPGVPDKYCYGPLIGQLQEYGSTLPSALSKQGFLSASTSDSGKGMLGIDTNLRSWQPRILPRNKWFDLMTYRSPQWVSDFTYGCIYNRLRELAGFSKARSERSVEVFDKKRFEADNGSWMIIGEFNTESKDGRITHVLPANYQTIETRRHLTEADREDLESINKNSRVGLEVIYTDGSETESETVYISVYNRGTQISDIKGTGLFQVTVPSGKIKIRPGGFPDPENSRYDNHTEFAPKKSLQLEKINLRVNDVIADSFEDYDVFNVTTAPSRMLSSLNSHSVQLRKRNPDQAVNFDIQYFVKSFLDRHREYHKTNKPIENAWEFISDTEAPGLVTYYPEFDEFYIYYNWFSWGLESYINRPVVTTVQCWRPDSGYIYGPPPQNEEERWYTVAVTHEQKKKIWVSPEFFDGYYEVSEKPFPKPTKSQSWMKPRTFHEKRDFRNMKILTRVILNIGFQTVASGPVLISPVIEFPHPVCEGRPELVKHGLDWVQAGGSRCKDAPNRSNRHRPIYAKSR